MTTRHNRSPADPATHDSRAPGRVADSHGGASDRPAAGPEAPRQRTSIYDVVVKDAKFAASKIGNETPLAVLYGDREKNVVYGEFQRGLAVGLTLVGGCLCVLRLDRWWRGRILRNLGNRSRRRILRGKPGGQHQNSRSE